MSVYNTHRARDPFKDISAEELAELRGYKCEVRYNGKKCERRGTQRHHGLLRRGKSFLNVLINYQLVCPICHTETGRADSRENHIYFYILQSRRYGKSVVDNWMSGLPFKVRPDVLGE